MQLYAVVNSVYFRPFPSSLSWHPTPVVITVLLCLHVSACPRTCALNPPRWRNPGLFVCKQMGHPYETDASSLRRSTQGSRTGRLSRAGLTGVVSRPSTRASACDSIDEAPIVLPPLRWPSADHLSAKGMFVLESADQVWIRIGEEASPDLVGALFGVSSAPELPLVSFDE